MSNPTIAVAQACFRLSKDYSGVLAQLLRDASREIEDSLRREVALRAEVEILSADKARLDWLDEHQAAIEVNDEEVLTCRVSASDDFEKHGFSDPYNVREAIDAATKAGD